MSKTTRTLLGRGTGLSITLIWAHRMFQEFPEFGRFSSPRTRSCLLAIQSYWKMTIFSKFRAFWSRFECFRCRSTLQKSFLINIIWHMTVPQFGSGRFQAWNERTFCQSQNRETKGMMVIYYQKFICSSYVFLFLLNRNITIFSQNRKKRFSMNERKKTWEINFFSSSINTLESWIISKMWFDKCWVFAVKHLRVISEHDSVHLSFLNSTSL
jgi:hypothetical protein